MTAGESHRSHQEEPGRAVARRDVSRHLQVRRARHRGHRHRDDRFVTLEVDPASASAAGCNMIIPHEDTFWNDRDDTPIVSGDPLYKAKLELHDEAQHRRLPHPRSHARAAAGLHLRRLGARAIGLDPKHETRPARIASSIPETTLGALAADVQAPHRRARPARRRRSERQGQPHPPRRRLRHAAVNTPDIDVVISGEQQESRRHVRQPGIRARRRHARHRQGLDHARAHDLGGGRHAGDGAVDQGIRAGGPGSARQGRRAVVGSTALGSRRSSGCAGLPCDAAACTGPRGDVYFCCEQRPFGVQCACGASGRARPASRPARRCDAVSARPCAWSRCQDWRWPSASHRARAWSGLGRP